MSLVKKLVDRTGIKHWFAKSKIDSKIASTAPAPTALVPTAPASTAPFHFINPKDFEWGRVFLWDIEPSVIPEDLVDFFGQYNFEAIACAVKESPRIVDMPMFAIIEFATKDEALRAAGGLNNKVLHEKQVHPVVDVYSYLEGIPDPRTLVEHNEWYSV